MQTNKFNVLMDLQWGSCGKGKFAPYLAAMFDIFHVSCSHRPNAGHTVRMDGKTWVLKVLPSAVTLPSDMHCYLSAGASFDPQQFDAEVREHKPHFHMIHPRAMLVDDDMRELERENFRGIASTMQGAGAALIAKIGRQLEGLSTPANDWLDNVYAAIDQHGMLHEAAQGWELSIDHGWKYPHVTSRNCGTAAALDEMGVSPRQLGDVYGILRPFPIRVGDFEGCSSGTTPGAETAWETILSNAGAPSSAIEEHIQKYEYTTVTKRRRRVFEYSPVSTARAVRANGVTHLVVNFVQYLDWELAGERGAFYRHELPKNTRRFVHELESATGVPVWALGTGAEHKEVIILC